MTVFEYVKQTYEQLKAKKDCPYNEPLHYHHDGCPACSVFKEIFDIERQYWEDRADNNPDDGSWVGR